MSDASRLLDHEAKVAQPDTATIPSGETTPSRSWADVQSAVICETQAIRGGLDRQPFGGEKSVTHRAFFTPTVTIDADYLFRMDSGPYQGEYFRVVGVVARYEGDHIEVVADYQPDDTANDPLAGV